MRMRGPRRFAVVVTVLAFVLGAGLVLVSREDTSAAGPFRLVIPGIAGDSAPGGGTATPTPGTPTATGTATPSGTPTATATSTPTGTVSPTATATASPTGTIVPPPVTPTPTLVAPSITGVPPSPVRVGEAYNHTFVVGGSPAPVLSLSGSLPPGITRTGNQLSGAPTAPGSYTATLTAENAAGTASITFTILVLAVPQLDLDGPIDGDIHYVTTFVGGSAPIPAVDPLNLTLTDADSPNMASATITLLNRPDGAAESLALDPATVAPNTPISASYNGATGVLTLSGSAPIAQYQAALRSVTYVDSDVTPALGLRTVRFVVSDGTSTSPPALTTITVTFINTAPSFTGGPGVTVLEDAGAQTVGGWATAIDDGEPAFNQGLSFIVTGNTNTTLFAAGPLIDPATGTLTFTPAANANGTATITVVLQDNGGTAGGGQDTSAPYSFTVTVTAVNDAPGFTKGADQAVLEDAGAQTVAGWATAISPGPADEAGQTLTFNVTNDNNGLFSAQPAIAANGTLTYTPAPNANGVATVTVTLSDNGGTADGGVDTSAAQTFTITVTAVNDAPGFTGGADQAVLQNAGPQTVTAWATAISAGPANESGQTLTFNITGNTNAALFSAGPAIAANGTLTYTPALNATGVATITLVLQDNGGTANGGVDTSAAQSFTITVNAPTANLGISKTDGVTTAVPGTSVTYTIMASNLGPDPVAGATVSDTFPGTLSGVTWTCVGAGGGTCTAIGSGNINDTVNLPSGASVIYTATATVAAGAAGTLANTATVSHGGTDPIPGNNLATDTDTLTPQANLGITKTNGTTNTVPGSTTTYTIVASNVGPSATTATVADTFPAAITGATWTCVGGGGGTCTAASTGNINDSVSLPPGGSVTYTVIAPVGAAATGNLVNTATVTGAATDPTPGNNFATDTDSLLPEANLSITKTDGVTSATPGGSTTYTIVASNGGPSNATATVADTLPAAIAGATWTCVGAGGGTCTGAGSGNINDSVTLPSGSSVTYSVTANISAAATGSLSNTATITSATVADTTPGNDSATDTNTLVASANLSITKSNGVTQAGIGNSTTYTIVASNAGPSDVTGATVADTFESDISGATWTCVGAGGATCPANGSGNINATVNLPAGASVTFTVLASISNEAAPSPGNQLVNTATVSSTVNDPVPGNESATDTDDLVAVNHAPSFTKGTDPTVLEDAGAQTVAGWATNIDDNDADVQALTFSVTGNTNPGLFSVPPTISPTGTLTFTPAANANGAATITVTLSDDGGTANGGQDTSAPQTFIITVTALNDAPSFTKGLDESVNEDAGPQTVNPWATSINDGDPELTQTLTFLVTGNTNPGLFSVGPAVSATGVLTYTPAANANGTATITLVLQDNGGTANGGVDTSAPQTFTITVNPVNDPPVADNDAFDFIGNTELRVDLGSGSTPAALETTSSTFGVLDGDSDPVEGDTLSVTAITVGGCTDNSPPLDCSDPAVGRVQMQANGRFSFTPAPGDASATEVFQYTLSDNGSPAPASAVGTVTLTRFERVWYVNPGGGAGNGTSASPLNDLTSLSGAGGTGDVDSPSDYIFISMGNSNTTPLGCGIPLEAVQRLIGEHSGLSLPVNLNANGSPTALVAAVPGNRPRLANAGAVCVTAATGNTVSGVSLGDATDTLAGTNFGTLTLRDLVINTTGRALNLSTGTLDAVVTSITSSGGTNNILLDTVATTGTADLGSGALSGATGNAFDVSAGGGSFTYSGSVSKSSAGRLVSIINKTGGGVTLSGNLSSTGTSTGLLVQDNTTSGTFTFSGGTKTFSTATNAAVTLTNNDNATITFSGGGLAITTTSGIGFNATAGAAAINVTGTGNTISSTTGTALDVDSSTIGASGLTFQSISANGGTGNGITLNTTGSSGSLTVTGTGTAGSGGTIQNKAVGVSLANTTAPSLSWMQLNDFSDYAIRGTSVVGFTMANVVISGTNGNDPAADEGSVRFDELTGSALFTNGSISGTVETQVRITNTTGTLNRVTFSGVTFGGMNDGPTGTGDNALLIESTGSAVINSTIQNNTFTAARGTHINRILNGPHAADTIITGNTISNTGVTAVSGGGAAIRVVGGNNSGNNASATFNVSNNTMRDSRGTALAVNKLGGTGTWSGTIANNTVGVAGVSNSGSSEGSGIFSLADGPSGTYTAAITGNTVHQYGNFGILMQLGGSSVIGGLSANWTVTGNTVSNPGTLIFAKNGIQLNSGVTPGDTYQVCLGMGGAGALANSITGTGTDGGTDFRLRQRQATTVRLPGYAGANNDDPAVIAFAQGNNDPVSTPTGSAANTVPTGGGFIGGAACPTPP